MMENVLLRFPHLGEAIFQKVDNKSLASCQIVSASWYRFIQYQKCPKWIRVKHRQVKNLETLSKEFNSGLKTYDGSAIHGSFVRLFFSVLRNNRMYQNGYTVNFRFKEVFGNSKNFLKSKIFLKSNTPSSLKYANRKYYIYFYDPIH